MTLLNLSMNGPDSNVRKSMLNFSIIRIQYRDNGIIHSHSCPGTTVYFSLMVLISWEVSNSKRNLVAAHDWDGDKGVQDSENPVHESPQVNLQTDITAKY